MTSSDRSKRQSNTSRTKVHSSHGSSIVNIENVQFSLRSHGSDGAPPGYDAGRREESGVWSSVREMSPRMRPECPCF